jgi:hypothetical protein
MRAMRADCEDQRRRKVVKKILSKGESTGRPFAAFGAERLSDQSALRAPARWQLAQATEGEDPDDVGAGEREKPWIGRGRRIDNSVW